MEVAASNPSFMLLYELVFMIKRQAYASKSYLYLCLGLGLLYENIMVDGVMFGCRVMARSVMSTAAACVSAASALTSAFDQSFAFQMGKLPFAC